MDTLNYVKNKYNVPDNARRFDVKDVGRLDLYALFAELGFQTGCEVGVFRGENALSMFEIIPDLKLFCVDAWRKKRNLNRTKNNLRECKPILIRKLSMKAVEGFEDESLDFVYIDADHKFDFVMRDIIEWSKKVRSGGIVSGHDFNERRDFKVVVAVNAYVKAHKIKPWFVLDRDPGKPKRCNSWFLVKR